MGGSGAPGGPDCGGGGYLATVRLGWGHPQIIAAYGTRRPPPSAPSAWHHDLVWLVLRPVPGQLPSGWDGLPRRRPVPQAGELPAGARAPTRAPRVRPMRATVARTAVRRLRRWYYIVRAFIYLFAWAAWFQSFCISPPGLGSRPRPILRDTVSPGPRLEKGGCRVSPLLVSAPAPPLRVRIVGSSRRALGSLAAEAGAGEVVLNYLRARGLARTATLALVEPTQRGVQGRRGRSAVHHGDPPTYVPGGQVAVGRLVGRPGRSSLPPRPRPRPHRPPALRR